MNLAKAIKRFQNDPEAFARHMFGITLDDWQAEVAKCVSEGHRQISVRSGHGVGKGLCVDSSVLKYREGWVWAGNVQVGDTLVSGDGTPTKVVGVYPQGDRPLFRVTLDDGCSVVVDDEHRWLTYSRSERKHGKPGSVRTTIEIMQSLTFPNGPRHGLNHMLPTVEPVQHPERDYPLHPYALGVWLGEGTHATVHLGDLDVLESLHEYVETGAIQPNEDKTCWRVGLLGARPMLRDLGLFGKRSWEKFVPTEYMHGSVEQREALLQGLLDTDGTIGKNCAITFDSASEMLADAVAELVRSLGGVARRGSRIPKIGDTEHRESFRVYVALPKGITPFRVHAKAERYTPDWGHKNRQRVTRRFIKSVEPIGRGKSVCFKVDHPSELFVVKDHIVTHNTTLLAILAVWFIMTRWGAKVVITAPTSSQLQDALLPEMRALINEMPDDVRAALNVKQDRVEFAPAPDKNFISARTSRAEQPDALQGVHADHVLLIGDEASGIPDQVFDASGGSMSSDDAQMVLTGNPVRTSGLFWKTHTILKDTWKTFHVSCIDSPRVTQDFIDEKKLEYGEESNAFRIRVLGEFPTGDDDTVIPVDLIDSAVGRDIQDPGGDIIWGVDVARFGSDRSAICKRQGRVVPEPVRLYSKFDLMEVVGFVKQEWDTTPHHMRPFEIMVDSIGMGGGVADRLRELNLPAKDVNVSEIPPLKQRNCYRLRDELWFEMKSWFAGRDVRIPNDSVLTTELAMPRFGYASDGKLKVESKADMRRRGVRSPDAAESLMLTFASNAATALRGRGRTRTAIKRRIKGIV